MISIEFCKSFIHKIISSSSSSSSSFIDNKNIIIRKYTLQIIQQLVYLSNQYLEIILKEIIPEISNSSNEEIFSFLLDVIGNSFKNNSSSGESDESLQNISIDLVFQLTKILQDTKTGIQYNDKIIKIFQNLLYSNHKENNNNNNNTTTSSLQLKICNSIKLPKWNFNNESENSKEKIIFSLELLQNLCNMNKIENQEDDIIIAPLLSEMHHNNSNPPSGSVVDTNLYPYLSGIHNSNNNNNQDNNNNKNNDNSNKVVDDRNKMYEKISLLLLKENLVSLMDVMNYCNDDFIHSQCKSTLNFLCRNSYYSNEFSEILSQLLEYSNLDDHLDFTNKEKLKSLKTILSLWNDLLTFQTIQNQNNQQQFNYHPIIWNKIVNQILLIIKKSENQNKQKHQQIIYQINILCWESLEKLLNYWENCLFIIQLIDEKLFINHNDDINDGDHDDKKMNLKINFSILLIILRLHNEKGEILQIIDILLDKEIFNYIESDNNSIGNDLWNDFIHRYFLQFIDHLPYKKQEIYVKFIYYLSKYINYSKTMKLDNHKKSLHYFIIEILERITFSWIESKNQFHIFTQKITEEILCFLIFYFSSSSFGNRSRELFFELMNSFIDFQQYGINYLSHWITSISSSDHNDDDDEQHDDDDDDDKKKQMKIILEMILQINQIQFKQNGFLLFQRQLLKWYIQNMNEYQSLFNDVIIRLFKYYLFDIKIWEEMLFIIIDIITNKNNNLLSSSNVLFIINLLEIIYESISSISSISSSSSSSIIIQNTDNSSSNLPSYMKNLSPSSNLPNNNNNNNNNSNIASKNTKIQNEIYLKNKFIEEIGFFEFILLLKNPIFLPYSENLIFLLTQILSINPNTGDQIKLTKPIIIDNKNDNDNNNSSYSTICQEILLPCIELLKNINNNDNNDQIKDINNNNKTLRIYYLFMIGFCCLSKENCFSFIQLQNISSENIINSISIIINELIFLEEEKSNLISSNFTLKLISESLFGLSQILKLSNEYINYFSESPNKFPLSKLIVRMGHRDDIEFFMNFCKFLRVIFIEKKFQIDFSYAYGFNDLSRAIYRTMGYLRSKSIFPSLAIIEAINFLCGASQVKYLQKEIVYQCVLPIIVKLIQIRDINESILVPALGFIYFLSSDNDARIELIDSPEIDYLSKLIFPSAIKNQISIAASECFTALGGM